MSTMGDQSLFDVPSIGSHLFNNDDIHANGLEIETTNNNNHTTYPAEQPQYAYQGTPIQPYNEINGTAHYEGDPAYTVHYNTTTTAQQHQHQTRYAVTHLVQSPQTPQQQQQQQYISSDLPYTRPNQERRNVRKPPPVDMSILNSATTGINSGNGTLHKRVPLSSFNPLDAQVGGGGGSLTNDPNDISHLVSKSSKPFSCRKCMKKKLTHKAKKGLKILIGIVIFIAICSQYHYLFKLKSLFVTKHKLQVFSNYNEQHFSNGVVATTVTDMEHYSIAHTDEPCISALEVYKPWRHVVLKRTNARKMKGGVVEESTIEFVHIINPSIRYIHHTESTNDTTDYSGNKADKTVHSSKFVFKREKVVEWSTVCSIFKQKPTANADSETEHYENLKETQHQAERDNMIVVRYFNQNQELFEKTFYHGEAYCIQHYDDVFSGDWPCDEEEEEGNEVPFNPPNK